jgi:hypothetical protein
MLTHPNKTPPNATKKPITMASHDFPAVYSGFLIMKPISMMAIEETVMVKEQPGLDVAMRGFRTMI